MFVQPESTADGASTSDVSSGREVPAGYVLYELPSPALLRPLGFVTTLLVLTVLVPTLLPFVLVLSSGLTEGWSTWFYGPVWFLTVAMVSAIAFVWWCRRIVCNGRLLGASTRLRTRYVVVYVVAVAVSSMLWFEPFAYIPARALTVGASFVMWSSLWRVSDAAPVRRVSVLIVLKTVALAVASVLPVIIWSSDRISGDFLALLIVGAIVDVAHVGLTIAAVLAISIKQMRRLSCAPTLAPSKTP